MHQIAGSLNADIALRIDDIDALRVDRRYVLDIFDALNWLDLAWSLGPESPDTFPEWSQSTRMEHYQAALQVLIDLEVVYRCSCSRRDWTGYQDSECPRGCRSAGADGSDASWRLHLPDLVDPIIWRRDDLPAYHLTSVVDDDLWQVNLVIRGEDLRESTRIQRAISQHLPASTFHRATVLHHPVVVDVSGQKLSKTAGTRAAPIPRHRDVRGRIEQIAGQFVEVITADLPADQLRSLES